MLCHASTSPRLIHLRRFRENFGLADITRWIVLKTPCRRTLVLLIFWQHLLKSSTPVPVLMGCCSLNTYTKRWNTQSMNNALRKDTTNEVSSACSEAEATPASGYRTCRSSPLKWLVLCWPHRTRKVEHRCAGPLILYVLFIENTPSIVSSHIIILLAVCSPCSAHLAHPSSCQPVREANHVPAIEAAGRVVPSFETALLSSY